MRKCGIAYQPRGSWRRSFHSTQMIGGMPETRGRGTGGTERQKGKVREMRKTEPIWFSRIQWYHWRAVCGESCKHGFGKGRQEKVRKEPRLPPTSQYPTAWTEPTRGRALRRSPLSLDMGSRHPPLR